MKYLYSSLDDTDEGIQPGTGARVDPLTHLARRSVHRVLASLRHGQLCVQDPLGSRWFGAADTAAADSSPRLSLQIWRERFLKQLPNVREFGYPDEFIRMWEWYLAYCEGGFLERAISAVQVAFDKPACRLEPARYTS